MGVTEELVISISGALLIVSTLALVVTTPSEFEELAHFNKQVIEPKQPISVDGVHELPQLQLVELKKVAEKPPSGSHQDWMTAAGISPNDYGYVDYIIVREGHYDPCVVNGGLVDCSYAVNGGEKAYGVCQALPGKKMASAGSDWATNPITQLRWCNKYALERYGSWANAVAFWKSHKWW